MILIDDDQQVTVDDRQAKINLAEATAVRKKRQYKANPFSVIRDGLLKIKTKSGEYRKFVLNPIQDRLLTCIEDLWFRGEPIRIWILKARQEGVSTLIEAIVEFMHNKPKSLY